MRLKLDENIDVRLGPALVQRGHDVENVYAEGLSGSPDEDIYRTCIREKRILVTLDLDFSNPFRFPPQGTEGIIVVRPQQPVLPQIAPILLSALSELGSHPVAQRLWIAEPGRLRVYDPEEHAQPE